MDLIASVFLSLSLFFFFFYVSSSSSSNLLLFFILSFHFRSSFLPSRSRSLARPHLHKQLVLFYSDSSSRFSFVTPSLSLILSLSHSLSLLLPSFIPIPAARYRSRTSVFLSNRISNRARYHTLEKNKTKLGTTIKKKTREIKMKYFITPKSAP